MRRSVEVTISGLTLHIPLQVFLPPKEESRPEPLTMDHLAFAFSLYVIGIIFSIVLYAGERLVLLLCAV